MSELQIGQRVHLLSGSRAKLLWDRASYSARVEAGAEGVVCGPELLDRDGNLTTEAIQDLRGYPGTPCYEVCFLVTRPGYEAPQEAWAHITGDRLVVVDIAGRRVHPHGNDIEARLVANAADAVRSVPPIKQIGPKSWALAR